MKLFGFLFFLFCSVLINAQNDRVIYPLSGNNPNITTIEFHVDGMNNSSAQTTVVNSISNFPGKIILWSPNISTQTIKISFTKDEQAIDILELISATGYKPWYINANGMKVVLVGTNKTEEWYIKP